MNSKHVTRYVIGFVSSIILTLAAYLLVTQEILAGNTLLLAILVLAIIQLFVQLIFFLHLGQEEKPRWQLLMFINMASILLLIVLGSIWIMNNLNYHMMTPHETDAHMMKERVKGF